MRRPFKASELIVSNIIDIVDTFCQQEKEYADLANTDNTTLLMFFFIFIFFVCRLLTETTAATSTPVSSAS